LSPKFSGRSSSNRIDAFGPPSPARFENVPASWYASRSATGAFGRVITFSSALETAAATSGEGVTGPAPPSAARAARGSGRAIAAAVMAVGVKSRSERRDGATKAAMLLLLLQWRAAAASTLLLPSLALHWCRPDA
jgi:hypothetical protein